MPNGNAIYAKLVDRWKALRGRGDVRVREVACVNAPRTLLCVEAGEHTRPLIALSAGVHGDEPAGPYALLDLVENERLDMRFSYRIWPCMNPSGFDAGTRENVDGVDVNRTFGRGGGSPESRAILTANRDLKFALSIDLHEDCDAEGFYCYEYGGAALGLAVIAALEEAGFPIETLEKLDLGGPLLDSVIHRERGRVTADHFEEASVLEGLSYSLVIARNAARHALTFETPAARPLDERIAAHVRAVSVAIANLARFG
jgi:murein peptide amidase A